MAQDHKIFIAGAGGIGRAAGLLLREIDALNVDLVLGDVSQEAVNSSVEWIKIGSRAFGDVSGVVMPLGGTDDALETALKGCAVVLDCLPGSQAPRMAELAKKHGAHYANLTEYVKETQAVQDIAQDAETGFILQTGLAPGFIGVLAMGLYREFKADYGVEKVEAVTMKVGALTKNALPPHYYGFTWSPIGVATEYVMPAVVVRDYEVTTVPSLMGRETIVIDGVTYEADLTSGGAADAPQALAGKARRVDYKTLRWPGHYAWVDGLLEEYRDPAQRAQLLETEMCRHVPILEDDLVVVYASVKGFDASGHLRQKERSFRIEPVTIGGKTLRAIQSTTAAPLVECARMLLQGKYKGVVLQSQIDYDDFMTGPFVQAVYG